MATFYIGQRVRIVGPANFPEIGLEGVVQARHEGYRKIKNPITMVVKMTDGISYRVYMDRAITFPIGTRKLMVFPPHHLVPAVDFGPELEAEQHDELKEKA